MTDHSTESVAPRVTGPDLRRGRGRPAVPLAGDQARAVPRPDPRRSSSCSATRSGPTRSIHLTGTNGKTSTRDDRHAPPRPRPAHRPVHQPAPRADDRADLHRRRAARPTRRSSRRSTTSRRTRTWSTPSRTHPLSFFETIVGDGLRRLRGRPRRRRGRRGRHGRRLGRHQRRRRRGRGASPRSRSTTRSTSATTPAVIAVEKAGIIKPGAIVVLGRAAADVAAVLARAGRRGRRHRWPARASSSASTQRVPAVGGQLVVAAGPPRQLRRGVPAAVRRPPGPERRPRPGRGRGVPRRRAARRRRGPRGVRRGHLAGPARGHPAQPRPSCSTPRTTRTAPRRRPRRWRTRSPSTR